MGKTEFNGVFFFINNFFHYVFVTGKPENVAQRQLLLMALLILCFHVSTWKTMKMRTPYMLPFFKHFQFCISTYTFKEIFYFISFFNRHCIFLFWHILHHAILLGDKK